MARKHPGTPTGNAMTDANQNPILLGIEAGLGISAQSGNVLAQEAQAFGPNLDTANAQLDAVAADCMWPPSAQVTIPIIPGVYSQSFQIPCLLTYSEARAVFAVGLIIAGAQLILTGVGILVAAEVAPAVLTVAGIRSLGRRGGGGGGGEAPAAAEGEAAETRESHVAEHVQAPAIADARRRSDAARARQSDQGLAS